MSEETLVQRDVEWTPCPVCERKYPTASEQAIAIETYSKCAGCILVALDAPARLREAEVGYHGVICPTCAYKFDHQCATCAGTRIALELLDGSGYVDQRPK